MTSYDVIKSNIVRIIGEETKMMSTSSDDTILHYVKCEMNNTLMPLLKENNGMAADYRKCRDEKNKKLFVMIEEISNTLNTVFRDDDRVNIHLMSSIGAKLNLIDESDIDFGICINNLNDEFGKLDMDIFRYVEHKLVELGYVNTHNFNVNNPDNRYYSYEQVIDGVEVELKIRDYETSKNILRLHHELDNSLNDEQITLFTYAKFMFVKDKQIYKYFKKILYESVFCNVEGAFVFPVI